MKKLGLTSAIVLLLSGCVTPLDYLLVDSNPTGATVRFEDGRTCETPCPIDVVDPAIVTIAKAGYVAHEQPLITGQTGILKVSLELAAPTTGVEQTELPDL